MASYSSICGFENPTASHSFWELGEDCWDTALWPEEFSNLSVKAQASPYAEEIQMILK